MVQIVPGRIRAVRLPTLLLFPDVAPSAGPRYRDKSRRERTGRLWLALQLGPGWRCGQSSTLNQESLWPQAAAELRSAWTGEAPVPTQPSPRQDSDKVDVTLLEVVTYSARLNSPGGRNEVQTLSVRVYCFAVLRRRVLGATSFARA